MKGKLYKVSWVESRMIIQDVHTFVDADSKEDAINKVKNRETKFKFKPDIKITNWTAKYAKKLKPSSIPNNGGEK